jgi:ferritin-like metal-binding protein YciE
MGKGTGSHSLSREELMAETLQELFEHKLRDIYDAEHKLVRALESMAKKTPDESLAQGFREHRDATKDQIKRLEQVFSLLDKKPRRETCRGINGLIAEFTKFVKDEAPSDKVLTTVAIGAALKVENYEIVAYESLLRLTNSIELGDAVDPLRHNLLEERRTAEQLEAFADEMSGPVPGEEEDLAVVSDASAETITLPEGQQVISS